MVKEIVMFQLVEKARVGKSYIACFYPCVECRKYWHESRGETARREGGEGGPRLKDNDEKQIWSRHIVCTYENVTIKPIMFSN